MPIALVSSSHLRFRQLSGNLPAGGRQSAHHHANGDIQGFLHLLSGKVPVIQAQSCEPLTVRQLVYLRKHLTSISFRFRVYPSQPTGIIGTGCSAADGFKYFGTS